MIQSSEITVLLQFYGHELIYDPIPWNYSDTAILRSCIDLWSNSLKIQWYFNIVAMHWLTRHPFKITVVLQYCDRVLIHVIAFWNYSSTSILKSCIDLRCKSLEVQAHFSIMIGPFQCSTVWRRLIGQLRFSPNRCNTDVSMKSALLNIAQIIVQKHPLR